ALGTVAEKYISFDLDGKPVLRNICLMAGLGIGRNGSIEYYLSEKKTENDAKGIAPFLMAYNELIR
ncbi:MAG: glycosyl hydrolase, partial [Ruminococcus sp.]|nr:glycosyl hydrolase [Ruminococcus sp.]